MTRARTLVATPDHPPCWHCGGVLDPAGDNGDGLHPICAFEVEQAAAAALGPLPADSAAVDRLAATLGAVTTNTAPPATARQRPRDTFTTADAAVVAETTYGVKPHAVRGGNANVLADELIWHVRDYLANRPRSLQRRIGPSSLGTPCARRVGHIIAGTPSADTRPPGWLPGIGVAVHTMLESVIARVNGLSGRERFIAERRVTVGTVDGTPITGTCDLYDVDTATVVDWKVVGKSTLDNVRRKGASQQYITQAHLYGAGYVAAGHPVDRVAILYLPRGEDLDHARYAVHDYDADIAARAIARADGIAQAIRLAGAAAILPQLERVDDCRFCEYRLTGGRADPDNLDALEGCPGIDTRRTNIDGLIARA